MLKSYWSRDGMKKYIIKKLMNIIISGNKYNEVKLEEISYGLSSIDLLISKSIIIFTLAYLLKIFKEMIICTLFYNFIRMFSFGLHATKSWICLLTSTIVFLGIPILCSNIIISTYLKSFIGIIC